VIFAGDAAHQVSPFGARGANSGLEDAENIAWKLAAVLRGAAPASLLASYDLERGFAADDNIRASTHATDFMAPPSPQEQRLRQAVLALAKETEFAKRMINGGRLSVPSVYPSPLSTADNDAWRSGPCPGTHMPDVPLTTDDGAHVFLSECFATAGRGFTMLQTDASAIELPDGVARLVIGDDAQLRDSGGLFKKRYGADPGTAYLLRPDGYVAARFQHPTSQAVAAAFARASGRA
jgi:3-(3-hydroxy-phenyl)propionate hydroxylase